jgi:hypothetical protein
LDNTIQEGPPPTVVLSESGPLGLGCVTDDGQVRAWRISDGARVWQVDAAGPDGPLRHWLESSAAPKLTWFDLSTWRSVRAGVDRLAGAVDVGLAVEVLTAGLEHVRLDPWSVIAVFRPDLGAGGSELDLLRALVPVGRAVGELLVEAGLQETAVLETAVAPFLGAVAARGLPVDMSRWVSCVERARAAMAASVDRFAAVTGAPARLAGGVNLCCDTEVLDGFRRTGAAVPSDLQQTTLRTAALDRRQPAEFARAVEALLAFRGAKQVVDWSAAPGPDARLRGRWQQLGTATGRSTSADVNLHGVPLPLRAAVRAPEGCALVVADFAGQDLRVLAALSGDQRLAADLNEGDVYELVAHSVGVERKVAKPAVLAYFYGAGDERIAALLGRPVEVAKQMRATFSERFPDAARLLANPAMTPGSLPAPLAELAGVADELVMFRGVDRRRWVPRATSPGQRARQRRQAGNFPVQARAATVSKVALGRAARLLAAEEPGAAVAHFVVDELVVEAPVERCEAVAQIVRDAMAWAHDRKLGHLVRAAVEVHVVDSWADKNALAAL